MNYELFYKRDEFDVDFDSRIFLNKFVVMNFEDNIWFFIVRFLVLGVYKFLIFGGYIDCDYVLWIVDF